MFGFGGASKKDTGKVDEVQQARVTATVLINDNRMKVRKPMDEFLKVANSQYWGYGYILGTMLGTTATCLVVGNRFPVFRTYSSIISLGVGYFGGNQLHNVHNAYLKSRVIAVMNSNIEEMQKMNEQHGSFVPDYNAEIKSLKKMKYDLAPELKMLEGYEDAMKDGVPKTLDERVSDLIVNFEQRKTATNAK